MTNKKAQLSPGLDAFVHYRGLQDRNRTTAVDMIVTYIGRAYLPRIYLAQQLKSKPGRSLVSGGFSFISFNFCGVIPRINIDHRLNNNSLELLPLSVSFKIHDI